MARKLNLRYNSVIVNNQIIEIKAKAYDQIYGLEGISNLAYKSLKQEERQVFKSL